MMLVKRFYIINFLFLGVLISAFGQIPSVKTILDTNKIEIGDRLELKYVIEKSGNDLILFPTFTDTLILGVEILDSPKIDSLETEDNRLQLEQKLIITSFEEGMYFIPPQAFTLKRRVGVDTLYSHASYLEVVGVAVDTTGAIRDISTVQKAPIILRDFLPLFVLCTVAVITILIIRLVRRWKRNKGLLPAIEKPVEPAHIYALRELDKLKAQQLWQHNEIKEYYSRLSNIIRTYIEKKFGVLALEETTTEIIRDVKRNGLDKKINISQLEALLNLSDLVKFAKGSPLPEDNIRQLDISYEFIKETKELNLSEKEEKEFNDKIEELAKSSLLSKKIVNVKELNDLEVLTRIEEGAKLVKFQIAISIIVITYTFDSPMYLIKAGEKGANKGIMYSIVTILLGWWGIPWGPKRSITALKTNFSGGKQVKL